MFCFFTCNENTMAIQYRHESITGNYTVISTCFFCWINIVHGDLTQLTLCYSISFIETRVFSRLISLPNIRQDHTQYAIHPSPCVILRGAHKSLLKAGSCERLWIRWENVVISFSIVPIGELWLRWWWKTPPSCLNQSSPSLVGCRLGEIHVDDPRIQLT